MGQGGQFAVAVLEFVHIVGIELGSHRRNLAIEMGWEFGAHVNQPLLLKPQRYRRGKIESAQGYALEPVYGAGIVGPDFDLAVQIGIRSPEEVSAGDGSQLARRLGQGVD